MVPTQERHEEYGLCSGELQKPNHSLFLLDETNLQPGQLKDQGIQNLKAIQSCIDFGLVEYQIPYASFEKESNFSFLVIGKSKSLLNVLFS